MPVTMHYESGDQLPQDLQKIVDEMLANPDPELIADIAARGVDLHDLSQGAIEIKAAGAGLDPATVTLIVTFLGAPVLDVWKYILLPRIRRRWGIDAVGKELEEGHDD